MRDLRRLGGITMKTVISAIGGLLLGLASMTAQADTVVSVTQYSYDYASRPICTAVRMNPSTFGSLPADPCTPSTSVGTSGPDRVAQNIYDSAGQLLAVYQGVGTSDIRQYAYYNYTNNGLKTFEIDANHNKTSFTYDGFDRLSKIQYPNTIVGNEVSSTTDIETFTYDANSNRKTWVRRNGQTITYTYDKLNREIIADVPAHLTGAYNATEKDIYTTYDGLGHISKKAFASYTGTGVSYLYDGLGRVSSTTDMAGRTISYGYNAASARTQMTYPPLTISTTTLGYVTYTLDNLNRVSAMSYTLAATTTPIIAQTYDSLGRRTNLYRGTTTTSGAVASTAYAYDNLGRLSGLSNDVATAGYDSIWTFPTRNAAGQIVTWTSNSAVYDYVELATTAENKTYDGLNRDATIASVTGGYDTNGNMANDGSRAVIYDIYNRVLSVAPSATPNAPYLTLSYDPEGRLYQRAYSGTYDIYLYDGTNLIGEYASGGTSRRRYIHGTGVDEPLVWLEGQSAATPRYLISNYQGSIIAHTDSTGAIAQIYKYGPYGEPKNAANGSGWNADATTASRFQYTGQTTLPEAALYYYKARVYDPAMGRFLQTDPVGSKDDLDLYAYVHGDPINNVDPTGAVCEPCLAAALARSGGRYLIAGITTQVDSPLPGPADVVGIGLAVVTTGALVWDVGSAILQNDQATSTPSLPEGLVGEQDDKSGPRGKGWVSGPLSPDYGGTGDADQDFDQLTGGQSGPAPAGDRYPDGTRKGDNGITIRPGTDQKGPRIDIPANGDKPHEDLHYPKP